MTDNIDKYVDWELERHSWLSKSQAKRIVEENLADDPEFYAFIEDEVEEFPVTAVMDMHFANLPTELCTALALLWTSL